MTRETKISLLVGLAFIIVIGILLPDHFRSTQGACRRRRCRMRGSRFARRWMRRERASRRSGLCSRSDVTPTQSVPTHDELTRPAPPVIPSSNYSDNPQSYSNNSQNDSPRINAPAAPPEDHGADLPGPNPLDEVWLSEWRTAEPANMDGPTAMAIWIRPIVPSPPPLLRVRANIKPRRVIRFRAWRPSSRSNPGESAGDHRCQSFAAGRSGRVIVGQKLCDSRCAADGHGSHIAACRRTARIDRACRQCGGIFLHRQGRRQPLADRQRSTGRSLGRGCDQGIERERSSRAKARCVIPGMKLRLPSQAGRRLSQLDRHAEAPSMPAVRIGDGGGDAGTPRAAI